jgi:glyoxylase-like metal-dependent hydrolase (beta-lactamase superfamily II)
MPTLPPVKKFVSTSGVRIYRIPCQVFETLTARVYLLLGAGPPTLLDAGSGLGASTQQILAGLQTVGERFGEHVRANDIARIIISHGHVDHIGGLSELVPHTAAQVAVHPLDCAAIVAHHEFVTVGNSRLNDFLRRSGVDPARRGELLKISHYVGRCVEGVAVAQTLSDGQQLDGLRIIHTPGHSPGHICIGVGNILLSADHILAQTIPQQWPESTGAYTGLGHYLDSLEKIERMPGFELTLGAHEQTIHDLHGRIKTIRASLQRRLDRLLTLLGKASRPLSVDEITRQSYPEATGFRAVLAITDVGSRVEYLHQRGVLTVANLDEVEREQDPVYRYCVSGGTP